MRWGWKRKKTNASKWSAYSRYFFRKCKNSCAFCNAKCKEYHVMWKIWKDATLYSCIYVFFVLRLINSTKLKLKYLYRDYVVRFERVISFSLSIFPHTYRLRQNHWLVRAWIPCINIWGFTRCSNPCVRVATQDVARATYLRFFVAWPYPLFVYVRTIPILVYEIYF